MQLMGGKLASQEMHLFMDLNREMSLFLQIGSPLIQEMHKQAKGVKLRQKLFISFSSFGGTSLHTQDSIYLSRTLFSN
jgi:hypothetical protein